jgi:predicted ArsR family transcriptional regulator
MNNIAIALTKAGVQVPTQKQRIWQYLNDCGDRTARALAHELNIPEPSLQAALTDLQHRGMVEKREHVSHKGVREHNTYSSVGKQFEMLPLRKKGAAKVPAKVVYEPQAALVTIPEFKPEVFLGKLTLSELRSVHAYLGRLFK